MQREEDMSHYLCVLCHNVHDNNREAVPSVQ